MDDRIIRTKIEAIRRSAVIACWPVGSWQARTADFVAVGEYRFDDDWTEIAARASGPVGKTLFIRTATETPPGVPLEDLFLQFDAEGLEGLLSVNGRPYAGLMPITCASSCRGGTLGLEAEFVCLLAALHRADCAASAPACARWLRSDRSSDRGGVLRSGFACEASQHVKDARRKQLIHAALEAALVAVDLTAPADEYRLQVIDARDILAQCIGAIAPDPEAGRIYLTGHSHIDTAWLWPLRETVRKCAHLRHRGPPDGALPRLPLLLQPAAAVRLHQGALPRALRGDRSGWRPAAGRAPAGMWVESDCNVPSGEALIRQILHGLRFFREEFGTRPHSLWLPDVFGYPASLPQILQGCGLRVLLHQQAALAGAQPFPVNLFWWEGIDGTRVLAHIPKLRNDYNGSRTPEQLTLRLGQLRAEGGLRRAALPLRLWRRRRRPDRGDARVHGPCPGVPRPARLPPGWRRGVLR